MTNSHKKLSARGKVQGPLSPTYLEGKDEESLLIGKAFSNFPVEKLLSENTYELLTNNFKQIVEAIEPKHIVDEAIQDKRIIEALNRWLKWVTIFSLKTLLDKQGYIQTRRLDPLGWRGGVRIYQQEYIHALMVSYVKVLIQQIIKKAFNPDKVAANRKLQSLLSYVGNYLSPNVRKMIESKHKLKPLTSSKKCIDYILKEFVQTLESQRKPKDYKLMGALLELQNEKMPLSELAEALDVMKSSCIPEGFFIKIITKYREIIELALSLEKKQSDARLFTAKTKDEADKDKTLDEKHRSKFQKS